jgi:hypothetical protein
MEGKERGREAGEEGRKADRKGRETNCHFKIMRGFIVVSLTMASWYHLWSQTTSNDNRNTMVMVMPVLRWDKHPILEWIEKRSQTATTNSVSLTFTD